MPCDHDHSPPLRCVLSELGEPANSALKLQIGEKAHDSKLPEILLTVAGYKPATKVMIPGTDEYRDRLADAIPLPTATNHDFDELVIAHSETKRNAVERGSDEERGRAFGYPEEDVQNFPMNDRNELFRQLREMVLAEAFGPTTPESTAFISYMPRDSAYGYAVRRYVRRQNHDFLSATADAHPEYEIESVIEFRVNRNRYPNDERNPMEDGRNPVNHHLDYSLWYTPVLTVIFLIQHAFSVLRLHWVRWREDGELYPNPNALHEPESVTIGDENTLSRK